jgi:uncharacterized protein YegL
MKQQKLTEIVCIIDRSGSMGVIRDDAIGSFNTFLKDQQSLSDEALMTIVLFDDQYEIMHNGTRINYVPPLTTKTYIPRGSTALFDAIGRTINDVKSRISRSEDKRKIPDNVIVAVLTDGEENASTEFNLSQIEIMIKKQFEQDHWNFIYLSADPKAFEDARMIGIARDHVVRFDANSEGIQDCCMELNKMCYNVRADGVPKREKRE